MEYTIQIFKPENVAVFTFWGKANTLIIKDGKKKRTFFAYRIASKDQPIPAENWTLGEYQFAKSKSVFLKKDKEIAFVFDELGNKYFEITDLI